MHEDRDFPGIRVCVMNKIRYMNQGDEKAKNVDYYYILGKYYSKKINLVMFYGGWRKLNVYSFPRNFNKEKLISFAIWVRHI